MAKNKKQSLIEREKSKKGNGTLSGLQLISVYIAAVLIVILCLVQAVSPEEPAPHMYYLLAVLAVAYALFITFRNEKAKHSDSSNAPRLK